LVLKFDIFIQEIDIVQVTIDYLFIILEKN